MTAGRRAMPDPPRFTPFRICLTIAALLLLSLSTACQMAHQPGTSGHLPPNRPKPAISIPELEKRIHALINHERARQGLPSLAWDEALARVARGHSKDMAGRAYFSHNSPEGLDFSYRYREQGYTCALQIGQTIHAGAENIALASLYRSVTTINGVAYYDWSSSEQIAASTVQGWMNSPGHRKNILAPHWLNQGIGAYISADDKVHITQNFC